MRSGLIKEDTVMETQRLGAGYHLSPSNLVERAFEEHSYEELNEYIEEISTSGRGKRVYVDKEFGYPYLGNVNLSNMSPFDSCNYTSRKFYKHKNDFIKENMILTGRVGQDTVGQYILANDTLRGAIGSDNVIKVELKKNTKYGYLYAFLSSYYGFIATRKHISGAAQPFVNEDVIKEIKIPNLSKKIIEKANDLIIKSNKSRENAQKSLKAAVAVFDKKFSVDSIKVSRFSMNAKLSNGRLDAFHNIKTSAIEEFVASSDEAFIAATKVISKCFLGPRAKRSYIESGVPFLSTQKMLGYNPLLRPKCITAKTSKPFLVKEGTILVSRSGSVGNCCFVTPVLNGIAVSEHALRVEVHKDSPVSTKYLFAFYKSNLGRIFLSSGIFGSVIQHINEDHLFEMLIPQLNKKLQKEVDDHIFNYINNYDEQIKFELQAIEIVEEGVRKWLK